jgi:hypothetical protein
VHTPANHADSHGRAAVCTQRASKCVLWRICTIVRHSSCVWCWERSCVLLLMSAASDGVCQCGGSDDDPTQDCFPPRSSSCNQALLAVASPVVAVQSPMLPSLLWPPPPPFPSSAFPAACLTQPGQVSVIRMTSTSFYNGYSTMNFEWDRPKDAINGQVGEAVGPNTAQHSPASDMRACRQRGSRRAGKHNTAEASMSPLFLLFLTCPCTHLAG